MTGPTRIRISRREGFNAAHQLWDPARSDDENRRLFGKCVNLHGHNYAVEVVVRGDVDPATGWELLYRLEPGLYDRLIKAERIHPAVIDWLPRRVPRIVEVGAGSGRLTTDLVDRCNELVAIEPAAPLRELLAAKLAAAGQLLRVIDGFFDDLPVADRSANLVVA